MNILHPFLTCRLCGKPIADAQAIWCPPCHNRMEASQPRIPLTPEDVLALPAYALPYVLWVCGLADTGVTRLDKAAIIDPRPEARAPYFYKGQRPWRPHRSLDDCAYLWERFRLDIRGATPRFCDHAFQVWGTMPIIARTYKDLAAAVCRMALIMCPMESSGFPKDALGMSSGFP